MEWSRHGRQGRHRDGRGAAGRRAAAGGRATGGAAGRPPAAAATVAVVAAARAEDGHGQRQGRTEVAKAHGCHLLMVPGGARRGRKPSAGRAACSGGGSGGEASRRQSEPFTDASMPRRAGTATPATGEKSVFRPPPGRAWQSCAPQRPCARKGFRSRGRSFATEAGRTREKLRRVLESLKSPQRRPGEGGRGARLGGPPPLLLGTETS